MHDNLDLAILHTLKRLQDDAQPAAFFSADEIVAESDLPRWQVATHLTHGVVGGSLLAKPLSGATPQYRLAPRGEVRLLRTALTRQFPATAGIETT
jgi:hypothetical protein